MMMKPDFRMPSYYTLGYWRCEPERLYNFLQLLTSQPQSFLYKWFGWFDRSPARDFVMYPLFPIKVKENIALHYNTSPEFMKHILGENLEYTCAFFEQDSDDLEVAQNRKIEKVSSRLALKSSDRVLDLGCGWGQIAEAVSSSVGCHVTGVNISDKQVEYAMSRKSQKTEFVRSDFSQFAPNAKFNRIYSIGMLEHVGRGYLPEYFSQIFNLLTDDGRALIHCIVRKHRGATNSWVDQVIFPGAYIPELAEIIRVVENSPLKLIQVFTHDKSNYRKTLIAWGENFYRNYDLLCTHLDATLSEQEKDIIMRIWEFYLCSSRLIFNTSYGYCYNVQILLEIAEN